MSGWWIAAAAIALLFGLAIWRAPLVAWAVAGLTAAGRRRLLSEETIGAEAMGAARLSFGLFGVIARVRLRVERAAPVLGQHTDEVLTELGFSPAQVEQMHTAGVVIDAGRSRP